MCSMRNWTLQATAIETLSRLLKVIWEQAASLMPRSCLPIRHISAPNSPTPKNSPKMVPWTHPTNHQTASRSSQPFLQNSRPLPTDGQTHGTRPIPVYQYSRFASRHCEAARINWLIRVHQMVVLQSHPDVCVCVLRCGDDHRQMSVSDSRYSQFTPPDTTQLIA